MHPQNQLISCAQNLSLLKCPVTYQQTMNWLSRIEADVYYSRCVLFKIRTQWWKVVSSNLAFTKTKNCVELQKQTAVPTLELSWIDIAYSLSWTIT